MIRNIQTELTNWANILVSSKLCSDVSPITNEIGRVRRNNLYHIQKLKIGPFNPPRNTIPNKIDSLYVLLDIKFKWKNRSMLSQWSSLEKSEYAVTVV